ncbi:uncharacterized protein PRCAT00005048001 [Priceomyces carsonii]|uniref:uncharacterized protein n=1 Tax=Priceomyces carsonii TaxID=28549 RepID=UPI002EDB44B6|nr:unnamed protein product [Priceomyces carsonii]
MPTSKSSVMRGPIPVTLISGFLGSGKTTLLENILTANHDMRIAVIVNDVSSLNIDAELIKNHRVTKKEEKLIQLQNGCICCTLRGDLLEELVTLAKDDCFQYIVIESTGISEPMQVAETFTAEFTWQILDFEGTSSEQQALMHEVLSFGGLNKLTRLDTCVTVIDSKNFLSNLETTDFLIDRYGDRGQSEGERTITDLLIDQIEFSDVIIINKMSMVRKKKLKKIKNIIHSLNPVAKVLMSDYSKVDLKDVLNTRIFDFEKAATSAGWLQSIHEMTQREGFGKNNHTAITPKPETEEYGINNFVYTSRRPFHPQRLYNLIRDKFIVIEKVPDFASMERDTNGDGSESDPEDLSEGDLDGSGSESDENEFEDPSDAAIIKSKKTSAFGPLLRSKGFFWLATRFIVRGEWSSAGTMMTLGGSIPWFDVEKDHDFPSEVAKLIERDMQGKYGDRRNEIVFIGLKVDKAKISDALNTCLLNDDEYLDFEKVIKEENNLFRIEKKLQEIFEDGFEDWIFMEEDTEECELESSDRQQCIHNNVAVST